MFLLFKKMTGNRYSGGQSLYILRQAQSGVLHGGKAFSVESPEYSREICRLMPIIHSLQLSGQATR